MIDALKTVFGLVDGEAIYWEDLDKAEVNKWINLHTGEIYKTPPIDSVCFRKMPTKAPRQFIFITRIYKGSKGYHSHRHPDSKETCTAINGCFLVNDKDAVYDTVTFYPNTKHSIQYHDAENGLDYVDILVEFNKSK